MRNYLYLCRRELLLAYRHRMDWLNPIAFFILIVTLFPIAVSVQSQELKVIGPGVLWIAVLLATLLSLENLFQADYDDGSLEQMILSTSSLISSVLAKITVRWLTYILPLIVLSPLLACGFSLPPAATYLLIMSLLLGTPVLLILGAMGAAITLGLNNKGMLLILMMIPLYIPVLIFAISAISNAVYAIPSTAPLAFLAAMLCLALSCGPLSIALTLRLILE